MKKIVLMLVLAAALFSCTENARVKHFGGTGHETLPKGEKLVTATWKNDELWILTKDMAPADSAETYYFREKSSYGVIEGEFIIKEQK